MAILMFIQSHWVEWLFAAFVAILGLGQRSIAKKLSEEKAKNVAIGEGVKSLLRESIVGNYNKYQDKGFCPIYAKESIKAAYQAYHQLGGNDVATELYKKLLAMKEEKEEEKG